MWLCIELNFALAVYLAERVALNLQGTSRFRELDKRMISLCSSDSGLRAGPYRRSGVTSMTADSERYKDDPNEGQTDLQLVRKVRHGDRPAFDLLVIKYQSRVASIIGRYIYDHQEVMDLTQETFVKAFRAIERFRGDSAFYTWLYRIAVNTGKNYLSKKRVKDFVGLEKIETLIGDNSSDVNEETKNYLQQAIQKLPPKQTMVVLLRSFQELPYKKIGAILNISENSAKVNFSHALKNLRKKLKKMGVEYEQL